MTPLGYHLVLRLGDDRVIAPSRAGRRRWARQLAALARVFPVIAWKLADTHLYAVRLQMALRAALGAGPDLSVVSAPAVPYQD